MSRERANNKASQKILRRSRVREAIHSFLEQAHSPVSALDMQQYLNERGISANKTTVYRTIAHFEREGVVHVVRFDERENYYELVSLGHHHHAVCVECRDVAEVDAQEESCPRGARVVTRSGSFEVFDHALEFFGLCPKCQNESK